MSTINSTKDISVDEIGIDKFWNRVSISGLYGCWQWTGAVNNKGYGIYWNTGKNLSVYKTLLAHRVSWVLRFGAIARGLLVLHRCDNTRCVNPDHLFLGTQKDNITDSLLKGRHRYGCLRGESHPESKLTNSDVREIRSLIGTMSFCAIARKFNVNNTAIHHIHKGRTWVHVK